MGRPRAQGRLQCRLGMRAGPRGLGPGERPGAGGERKDEEGECRPDLQAGAEAGGYGPFFAWPGGTLSCPGGVSACPGGVLDCPGGVFACPGGIFDVSVGGGADGVVVVGCC